MTVLSNSALIHALDEGRLNIEPRPEPSPKTDGSPYGATSVDLHLNNRIRVPKRGLHITFDIRKSGLAQTLKTFYDEEESGENGWALEPQSFILGRTEEKIDLPLAGALAARVEGRSSFARVGLLIHCTAPTIHAGFKGNIALEIVNLGQYPITLWPGLDICQLIVETVEGEIISAESQFHGQSDSTGTK